MRTGMLAAVVFLQVLFPVYAHWGKPNVTVLDVLSHSLVNRSISPGNLYGFEGGTVLKLEDDRYHLFTTEFIGDPHWINSTLGHWHSAQGSIHGWARVGTLFTSTRAIDPRVNASDPKAQLSAPMPAFNTTTDRWEIFYVGYHSAPNNASGWLVNFDGRVYRSVSQTSGRAGIDGPYRDVAVVLEPGSDSQSWEGLQGVDSLSPPYKLPDGRWAGFYGSADTQHVPCDAWRVGLATAPSLAGPWTRQPGEVNPVALYPDRDHTENPVVLPLGEGRGYLAVFDALAHESCGDFGHDGLSWSAADGEVVRLSPPWSNGTVRTPLGLVEEEQTGRGSGVFSLWFTGWDPNPHASVSVAWLKIEWNNNS